MRNGPEFYAAIKPSIRARSEGCSTLLGVYIQRMILPTEDGHKKGGKLREGGSVAVRGSVT